MSAGVVRFERLADLVVSAPRVVGAAARYLAGLDRDLCDRRPAWLSIAICRVLIFATMLYICHRTWQTLSGESGFLVSYGTRVAAPYHPFGILRLFGPTPPPAWFLIACSWTGYVASICAVVGLITRPAMILSVLSVLILVLFNASSTWFWSHTYNVVFLAAIPFALCNAGSSLAVDRMLGRFASWWPFGRRTEPVLWGILAAQAAAALFYFASFWAKIFWPFATAGLSGTYYYVFSDNMRNILGMSWLGTPEKPVPPWIEFSWSYPIVWQTLIFGHLVMQAVPIAALFSTNKPWWRLFEGSNFVAGVIALGVFMDGWNWHWLPLGALFVDWDYFVRAATSRLSGRTGVSCDRPAGQLGRIAVVAPLLTVFFGIYITGFMTQRANKWLLYPFSSFNFYSILHMRPPYHEHRPYADYMMGEMFVELPPGARVQDHAPRWHDGTHMNWRELQRVIRHGPVYRVDGQRVRFPYYGIEFHGIGREANLDLLRGGMLHVAARFRALSMPLGGRFVVVQKTAGIPAYPEPIRKKTLHEGVRGIYDPNTSQFAGLSVELNRDTGVMTVKDIRGETGDWRNRKVLSRANAIDHSDIQPLEPVPGRWLDEKTYQIDLSYIRKTHYGQFINSIVRTETIFGQVDFDGFV